jgi:putative ABC transport system permease protein
MWRNYLSVGIRSLVKNRTYAFVTVAGLAIGMAACLMILLFVRYELSYDDWLESAGDIYQVQTWYHAKDTGQSEYVQMAPYPTGAALMSDFPQIERQVFAMPSEPVLVKDGQASVPKDFLYVDGNFLDVVPLPLVAGRSDALDEIGNAAITQREARRIFGTEAALGKTLTMITKGVSHDYRVAAVLKDIPRNSHLRVSTLVRVDFPSYFLRDPSFLTCWGCQGGYLYLKLKPGNDMRAIDAALPAWEKRRIPDETSGEARFNAGDEMDWHLVNLREIHLGKGQAGAMAAGNDRETIATFGIIALLILAMAVVNFTNLATARAGQRAREVALRKVLGASRRHLITQFIGESILISALAMLIALAVVELLMPAYAEFLEADLALTYFGHHGVALPVLLLVLLVGTAGGVYPAFFLSRFQPAAVLKANQSAAEIPGSGRFRSVLVIGQFAISIGLIICTAVVFAQTVYARTADPGFRRGNLMQVDGLNRFQIMNQGDAIVRKMREVPGVEAAGRSGMVINAMSSSATGVLAPGRSKPLMIGAYFVDEGFLPTMDLKLLAGRWYRDGDTRDNLGLPYPPTPAAQRALAARGGNIVINALAVRRMGFASPAEAIGKPIRATLLDNEFGLVPLTIVGVVADTRFRSVKQPLEPMMFLNAAIGPQFLILRYHGDPATVRADVERVWRQFTRDVPFDAKLSEDVVREMYQKEEARAKTFAAFSLLAILVACLGLFGLAAFTAERRTREIGIRKVLGARTSDIVRLLAWQFSKPVLIANIIAWPVAWLVMRDWLGSFDARITLGPGPFLLAGALALAIAIGTIAGHALRVARANPIHALRYE